MSHCLDHGADASEEPPARSSSAAVELRDGLPSAALHSGPWLAALSAGPDWNDWRWQLRHRIRSVEALGQAFGGARLPLGTAQAATRFPLAITPYYAALIQELDPSDPIFAQAVPQPVELFDPAFLRDDPLEEDEDMPVPGLVHRYPDRALLLATTTCAMYCRHCTRKRVAGSREGCIAPRSLQKQVEYLRAHPEIHDVIISGGDPFTMTTPALERILAAVRSVPSVDIVRIGTRTPVTMPMRVDDELVTMLRRHAPVWVNTHFNHPRELTPEAQAACGRLVDAGIPVGNQSVLLRGINDDPAVMESLLRGLVRARVRPYYLYQCDLVRGVEHFRTPLGRGLQLMEYLRGRLSGLAIPSFVVDLPGGGGKIPLLPNYVVSLGADHTVLRNGEGMLVAYPDPGAPARSAPAPEHPTVYDLVSGAAPAILPSRTARHGRRAKRRAVRSAANLH
ncbi:MAG: KamA family radical SAM protein [Pseudomonadota bacterium]